MSLMVELGVYWEWKPAVGLTSPPESAFIRRPHTQGPNYKNGCG